MARSQARSARKVSGKLYRTYRKKKKHELGREPALTTVGEKKLSQIRVRGGHKKFRLFSTNEINVYDPKNKIFKQAKIKTVIENPANRNFIRRNIITKGCILDTEFGKVKVTSRPGQEGILNGVLVA